MVVILDLGDGLDESEQTVYDDTVAMLRRQDDTIYVWTNTCEVPTGRKPIPAGVVAWAEPDTDAANPRTDYEHSGKFVATYPRNGINECPTLAYIIGTYQHQYVEEQLRQEVPDVAAFGEFEIVDSTVFGYITRSEVLANEAPPTTPEQIEAFLAIDVEKRGLEILEAEADEYRMWVGGHVFAVYARNTLNGRQESLHGCYDKGWRYLREAVDQVVQEVTA